MTKKRKPKRVAKKKPGEIKITKVTPLKEVTEFVVELPAKPVVKPTPSLVPPKRSWWSSFWSYLTD